jgi:hypothetical protein
VIVARTLPEALQYASYPALSVGVLDFRIGSDDAEPVCAALSRRKVPFIFFTGLAERLPGRWQATPVVQKPARPETIIGALKFVLLPETRDIIAARPSFSGVERLARIDRTIAEGEDRVLRIRTCIAKLKTAGWDTSAAESLFRTMTEIIENMRAHRELSARLP